MMSAILLIQALLFYIETGATSSRAGRPEAEASLLGTYNGCAGIAKQHEGVIDLAQARITQIKRLPGQSQRVANATHGRILKRSQKTGGKRLLMR